MIETKTESNTEPNCLAYPEPARLRGSPSLVLLLCSSPESFFPLADVRDRIRAQLCIHLAQSGPMAHEGLDLVSSFQTPNNPLLAEVQFAEIEIEPTDTSRQQSYRLIDVVYAGTPFDSLSFLVTDLGKNRVQISEFSLNGPLSLETVQGTLTMDWESLELGWRL